MIAADLDDVLHLTTLGPGRAVTTHTVPVGCSFNADAVGGDCGGTAPTAADELDATLEHLAAARRLLAKMDPRWTRGMWEDLTAMAVSMRWIADAIRGAA